MVSFPSEFKESLKIALSGEFVGTKGLDVMRRDFGEIIGFQKLFGSESRKAAAEQEAAAEKYKLAYERANLAVQRGQERLTQINLRLAKAEADGKIEQVERYKRAALLAQHQIEMGQRNASARQLTYQEEQRRAAGTRAGVPWAIAGGVAGGIGTVAATGGIAALGLGAATVMPAMQWEDFLAQQGASVGWDRSQMARIQRDAFAWARQSGGSPNDYVSALTTGIQRGFGYNTASQLARTSGMIGLPRGLNPGDVAGGLAPFLSMFPQYQSNVMGLGGMVAKTSQVTGLSVTDLGGAAAPLLSLIASVGPQELPEAMAAVAALRQAGFDAGKAISLVARIYGRILTPGSAVLKAAGSVGLAGDFSTEALRSKGLAGILGDIRDKNLSPSAIGTLFGSGARGAGSGVLRLVGGISGYEDLIKQMQGTGASSVTNPWKEFLNLDTTKFHQLEQNFKQTAITIGIDLLPAVNTLLKQVAPLVKDFADWTQKHKDLIAEAVKLAPDLFAIAAGAKAVQLAFAAGNWMSAAVAGLKGISVGAAAVGTETGIAEAGVIGMGSAGPLTALAGLAAAFAYLDHRISDSTGQLDQFFQKLSSAGGYKMPDWLAAVFGTAANLANNSAPQQAGILNQVLSNAGIGNSGPAAGSSPWNWVKGNTRKYSSPITAVPTGAVFGTPASTKNELDPNAGYPGGVAGGRANAGVPNPAVHSDIQWGTPTTVHLPGPASARYKLMDANTVAWPKGGDSGGGNYQLWTTEIGGEIRFFHLKYPTPQASLAVWKGGWVPGGTAVAISGNTGNYTWGTGHLHVGMDATAQAYVYTVTKGQGWEVPPTTAANTATGPSSTYTGTTNIPVHATAAKAKARAKPPTAAQWSSWWSGQAGDVQGVIGDLFGSGPYSNLKGAQRSTYIKLFDKWAFDDYHHRRSEINALLSAGTISGVMAKELISDEWRQYQGRLKNPFAGSSSSGGVTGIVSAHMVGRCKAEAEANVIRRKQLGAANAGLKHAETHTSLLATIAAEVAGLRADMRGKGGGGHRNGPNRSAQRVPGYIGAAAGGLS